MANATAIADVSLETLLPMIVLVAVIVYCLAFGAVVAIIYAKYVRVSLVIFRYEPKNCSCAVESLDKHLLKRFSQLPGDLCL